MTTEILQIVPVWTDVGVALAHSLALDGVQIKITHMSVGDANGVGYDTGAGTGGGVGEGMTALVHEIERTAIIGGMPIGDGRSMQINALIEGSSAAYDVREFGYWCNDTLVMVYAKTGDPIIKKTTGVGISLPLTLSLLRFQALAPEASITVQNSPDLPAMILEIMAHEAKTNPHPQYALLPTIGNAKNTNILLSANTTLDISQSGSLVGFVTAGVTATMPDARPNRGQIFYFDNAIGGTCYVSVRVRDAVADPTGTVTTPFTWPVYAGHNWFLMSDGWNWIPFANVDDLYAAVGALTARVSSLTARVSSLESRMSAVEAASAAEFHNVVYAATSDGGTITYTAPAGKIFMVQGVGGGGGGGAPFQYIDTGNAGQVGAISGTAGGTTTAGIYGGYAFMQAYGGGGGGGATSGSSDSFFGWGMAANVFPTLSNATAAGLTVLTNVSGNGMAGAGYGAAAYQESSPLAARQGSDRTLGQSSTPNGTQATAMLNGTPTTWGAGGRDQPNDSWVAAGGGSGANFTLLLRNDSGAPVTITMTAGTKGNRGGDYTGSGYSGNYGVAGFAQILI